MTSRAITETTVFSRPMYVAVEASQDMIVKYGLDELRAEHISIFDDVLIVRFGVDDVTFETCRTVARPNRQSLTIPRAAIAEVRPMWPSA